MPSSNPIFFTDALKLLLIVPSYPMITSMTVTFLQFQIFSISLLRSWYFSIFSCSFSGTRVSKGQATYITLHVLSSSSKTSMSRLLCSRRWCLWTLKSHSTFSWSFSTTPSGASPCHLSLHWRLNFWHSFQWMACPTLSCPHVLYSFYANFLHSTVAWLIVSSLSPHSRHMCDTSIFSIVFLMLLVRTAWTYAEVRSYFLRIPQKLSKQCLISVPRQRFSCYTNIGLWVKCSVNG